MTYESTALWQNAFQARVNDPFASSRERLRVAYAKFWENACTLSDQIAKDLPGLTLHNSVHFTALWNRADQIAGSEFPLTPIEVFVFGGAILLHDLGNTTAAFENGLRDIENTPEWHDAVADLIVEPEGHRFDIRSATKLQPETHSQALFTTLRALHARKAESLGSLCFRNSTTEATFYLIGDDQLRIQLGSLMGLIGASHHWNISDLVSRLQSKPIGAVAGLPRDWTIRPMLLACLLRCADAVQIDQTRTPDFLYALLRLRGISELHWRAQNRLAAPAIDAIDPNVFVFTSSRPFLEDDADAWWIANDAIQVAHTELQACNNLLNDLRLPVFKIDRIRYAESPIRLSSLVEAKGWRPISAEVRINRVDKIVEMFGGQKLYGRASAVGLRELIQNAVDAIKLRRQLEPEEADFSGRVFIKLEAGSDGTEQGYWLKVEDDGLGMSEQVLTGPLIDFGSSYIASDLAKRERPGLSARGKGRIGRFGIGFFSVFMLSSRVLVTSRPYDEALTAFRTLSFRQGMTLRPLLLESKATGLSPRLSTCISVFLSQESLTNLLTVHFDPVKTSFAVTLEQLVGAICPMIDVDIVVQSLSSKRTTVSSQNWFETDRHDWLRRITLADVRSSPKLDAALKMSSSLLQFVDPTDPSAGLASIDFVSEDYDASYSTASGARAIGGLWAGRDGYFSLSEKYSGSLDHIPSGPQRSLGYVRAENKIADWATRQSAAIEKAAADTRELHRGALRIFEFGGDPFPIACIYVNREPSVAVTVLDFLEKGSVLIAPLARDVGSSSAREEPPGEETYRMVHIAVQSRSFDGGLFEKDELDFAGIILEPMPSDGHRSKYYALSVGGEPTKGGCLDVIIRSAAARGFSVDLDIVEDAPIATYVGKNSERDGLLSGTKIQGKALELRVCRHA